MIYVVRQRGCSLAHARVELSLPAATLRTNRYSPRTEAAYVEWIKRFIRFHGVRHPQEMGADEVKAFLGHLATKMNVAASTQNSASLSRHDAKVEQLHAQWNFDLVCAGRHGKNDGVTSIRFRH